MKTAIYIEDGIVQLVLTPQNKWEKDAVKSFEGKLSVQTFAGSFYDCRGGWIRQNAVHPQPMSINQKDDCSIILRVEKEKVKEKCEQKNTNFPRHLQIASSSKEMKLTTHGNYPEYVFINDLTLNEFVNIRYKIDM